MTSSASSRMRLLPRARVFAVVESEHQQVAESADLVVGGLEFVDHRLDRPDHEGVLGEVLRRDVVVGHERIVLVELGHAEHPEGRQHVLAHVASHHAVDGVAECLLVGLGDE